MLQRVCNTGIRDWSGCDKCILSRTRRRVALRRDSPHRSRIHALVIGEAPGQIEDALGIPFTGPSGKILNATLALVKFPFSYTITNTVCCRPQTVVMIDHKDDKDFYDGKLDLKQFALGEDYEIHDLNREPTIPEMEACQDHVWELIETEKPNVVLYFGAVAKFYQKKIKLPGLHLLHLAAILRQELKYLTIKRQARKIEKFLEEKYLA